MTRSISDEVSSLTVDTEEVGTVWFEEVVVAVSFDNINAFQNIAVSRNVAALTRSLQNLLQNARIKRPSRIVDVINSCLIIRNTTEVSLQIYSVAWETIARVRAGSS